MVEEPRACSCKKLIGQVSPHRRPVACATLSSCTYRRRSVRAQYFPPQDQLIVPQFCKPCDRRLARTIQPGQESPLCRHPVTRRDIVNGRQKTCSAFVLFPTLNPYGALGNRRKHLVRVDGAANDMKHVQPRQTGHRQKGCGGDTIIKFLQSCLDVAPKFDQSQVGPPMGKLCPAAKAGRSDHRARRKSGDGPEGGADEGVPHVLARQQAVDQQALWLDRRHILHRVDGDVHLTSDQCVLDLFREQALAADFLQGSIKDPVAGGLDNDDLECCGRQAMCHRQSVAGFMRLCKRKLRTARSDPERLLGVGHLHHGHGIAAGRQLDNAPRLALNGPQEAT